MTAIRERETDDDDLVPEVNSPPPTENFHFRLLLTSRLYTVDHIFWLQVEADKFDPSVNNCANQIVQARIIGKRVKPVARSRPVRHVKFYASGHKLNFFSQSELLRLNLS